MHKGLNSTRKPFLREVGSSLSRQISVVILGLLTTILIANTWGATGNGWYFMAQFLPNLAFTLTVAGLPASITYNLSSRPQNNDNLISWLLSRFPFLILSQWFAIAVYIWLLDRSDVGNSAYTLAMIAILVVLNSIKQIVLSVLQARKSILLYNKCLAIESATTLIFLFIFALMDMPLLLSIFPSIIMGVLIGFISPSLEIMGTARQRNMTYFKPSLLITYSLKSYPSALLAFLNSRFSVLFTTSFFGLEALGIFSIALNLTEKLLILTRSASISIFPRLAESKEEITRYTPVVAGVTFWTTLCLAILLAAAAAPLIDFFYGVQFSDAPKYIYLILPAIPFFAVNRILAQHFSGRGKPELNAITTAGALLINVALCFILYQHLQLFAVAIAVSSSMLINTFLKLVIWKIVFKQKVGPLFSPDITFIKRYLN